MKYSNGFEDDWEPYDKNASLKERLKWLEDELKDNNETIEVISSSLKQAEKYSSTDPELNLINENFVRNSTEFLDFLNKDNAWIKKELKKVRSLFPPT